MRRCLNAASPLPKWGTKRINNTVSQCENPPIGEDVSPGEIAAVEAALRHLETQSKNRWVLAQLAQWFLVLKMYKGIEISFAKSKDRKQNETRHRAILSLLMGMGEMLLGESAGASDKDLSLIGTSREMLAANVRYLREKYEQWYVDIDKQEMDRVLPKLLAETD